MSLIKIKTCDSAPTFGEIKEITRKHDAIEKSGRDITRRLESFLNEIKRFRADAKKTVDDVKKWVQEDYMDESDLHTAKHMEEESKRCEIAAQHAFRVMKDNF